MMDEKQLIQPPKREKTTKQLLREFYDDKKFLEDLVKKESMVLGPILSCFCICTSLISCHCFSMVICRLGKKQDKERGATAGHHPEQHHIPQHLC